MCSGSRVIRWHGKKFNRVLCGEHSVVEYIKENYFNLTQIF